MAHYGTFIIQRWSRSQMSRVSCASCWITKSLLVDTGCTPILCPSLSCECYPLVNKHNYVWKITIFNGNIQYKLPCSIAILVYQKVNHHVCHIFLGHFWCQSSHSGLLITEGRSHGHRSAVPSGLEVDASVSAACWKHAVKQWTGWMDHWIGFVGKIFSPETHGFLHVFTIKLIGFSG